MQDFGFLNINKPKDCTSHDIVTILRRNLGIKRIGHFGTLDPFATGVLVIGINDATRLFEYLSSNKVYLAEITFGVETDTNDITGNILQSCKNIPSLTQIREELSNFTGNIKQKPPIYSAVKINGKRVYKLARKNQISLGDLNEKEIQIYSIKIISYLENKLKLKIHCSSGTYIRSIARDLAKELNTYGILSNLTRLNIGDNFKIEYSINSEFITKETLSSYLISPLSVLSLPKIYLLDNQINDIYHGRTVKLKDNLTISTSKGLQIILDNNNKLVAIGFITNDCMIKPKKVFLKNGNI